MAEYRDNMNKFEKSEREAVFDRDGGRCAFTGCDKEAQGIAHGLPQRKWILKRFGIYIVHSRFNMWCSCHYHNDQFQINATSMIAVNNRVRDIKRRKRLAENNFS